MASAKRKIPVTIITGFLGSGKTTFLKYVLSENHGKRIAVIQNEFGPDVELTEETLLISKGGNREMFAAVPMPNGCICCTVKGDLLLTVENLVQSQQEFDYIFIECSGLAEPGSVASVFWVDEDLESPVYLDSIVTLIDAKHVLLHLDEVKPEGVINEAQNQIAFADRIIMNKKDLVTEAELKSLTQRIKEVNALAPVVVTEKSRVPLDFVLDINAFDFKKMDDLTQHEEHECSDPSHHHLHDSSVKTIHISEEGKVELDDFNSWLGKLLWETDEMKIFRCKGIINVSGESQKFILQGVHNLFDLQASGIKWETSSKRKNQLVFIGHHLDEAKLSKSFQELCLKS